MDETRYRVGPKFFIHAPPFKGRRSRKTGEFLSKRLARIQPPFWDAEPWQCSIYYFWWEFLRRHEGYRDCCERGGAGKYKNLYSDFGDVHAYDTKDFWKWWSEKIEANLTRGQYLFAEPAARQIRPANRSLNDHNSHRRKLKRRETELDPKPPVKPVRIAEPSAPKKPKYSGNHAPKARGR